MKLFLNKTSPYARMARIVVLEKGLSDRVELCWCDPWSDDEQLLAENPVGRIPALVTDTGIALSESLLIAIYLNDQQPDRNLIPDTGKEEVLNLAGLGVGLMDVSFTTVISRKYLDERANESVLSHRRRRAIQRTLERLGQTIDRYSAPDVITLGDIAVGVALEYLAFRLPELKAGAGAGEGGRALESWRRNIAQRPSFQSTRFL